MKKQSVKKATKWLGVIVLGGLLLTGCKHQAQRSGFIFDMVAYKLDMTDEQEVKWYAVRDEMKRLRDEAKQDKQTHINTLIGMINDDSLDQQQALNLVLQHQEKVATAAPSVIAKLAEFHLTLTPEQKEKIVDKIESHLDH